MNRSKWIYILRRVCITHKRCSHILEFDPDICLSILLCYSLSSSYFMMVFGRFYKVIIVKISTTYTYKFLKKKKRKASLCVLKNDILYLQKISFFWMQVARRAIKKKQQRNLFCMKFCNEVIARKEQTKQKKKKNTQDEENIEEAIKVLFFHWM